VEAQVFEKVDPAMSVERFVDDARAEHKACRKSRTVAVHPETGHAVHIGLVQIDHTLLPRNTA
jgi:hypothetical protein